MSQENTSISTNTTSSITNNNTSSNLFESVTHKCFTEQLPIESRIEILKTSIDAIRPISSLSYGTFEYDLFCINDVTIDSNTSEIIDTGIVLSFDLSHRYFPKICDNPAVVLLKHCHVLGGILVPGGYTDSIKVILFNFDNNETIYFQKGDPIAQIIFFPILIPKLVPQNKENEKFNTVRGELGFGEVTKKFLHEMSQENTSVSIDTSTTTNTTTANNDSSNSDGGNGIFIRKENVIIEFFKTRNDVKTPIRFTPNAVGYDLFCMNNVTIESNTSQIIDTGIVLSMDPNARYFPKICDKFSVANYKNCHVLGGILDPGYRGSIKVILLNCDNKEAIHFSKEEILAQIVFFPVLLPKLNLIRNDYGITGDRIHGNVEDDFHHTRAVGNICKDSDLKTSISKNTSINIDTTTTTTTNNNNNNSIDDNNNNSGDVFDGFVGTEKLTIDIFKTSNDAIIPKRLSPDSVGYDLFCIKDVTIKSNKIQIIDTGIYLCKNRFDEYHLKICDKSSVVWKKHCHVLGGTMHPNHRESIKVILFNYDNNEDVHFQKGDPIAQIVFFPVLVPYLYTQNEKKLWESYLKKNCSPLKNETSPFKFGV